MKHQYDRWLGRWIGLALFIGALSTSGLFAQEQQHPYKAGRSLSLIEAMELAVQEDPSIRLAEQARTLAFGLLQQNAGPFDSTVGFSLSFDSARSLLNDAQLKAEAQKRDLFRQLSVNLDAVADDLQEQLGGTGFVWADCPQGLDLTIGDQHICRRPKAPAQIT